MKLYDVYVRKNGRQVIQIESYATKLGVTKAKKSDMIVVVSMIGRNGGSIGSSPSFNEYGSVEEIEEHYELLVTNEELKEFSSWEEVMKLAEEREVK